MSTVEIPTSDLRALLEVVEGYVSENGLDSVARYAAPSDVRRSIVHVLSALDNSENQIQRLH